MKLAVAIVLILTYYRRTVRSLETLLGQKQTGASKIRPCQARGDLAQLLGTFQILGEYEDLILLSTTSRQASLDLIGVKPDSIDFIEFKKKGATLQSGERRIKQLIDEKKRELQDSGRRVA